MHWAPFLENKTKQNNSYVYNEARHHDFSL